MDLRSSEAGKGPGDWREELGEAASEGRVLRYWPWEAWKSIEVWEVKLDCEVVELVGEKGCGSLLISVSCVPGLRKFVGLCRTYIQNVVSNAFVILSRMINEVKVWFYLYEEL